MFLSRSIISIAVLTILAFANIHPASAADPLAKYFNLYYRKGEDYTPIRDGLLHDGWKPVHVEDADTCQDGDTRCVGRPEMEHCAGTGEGNCRFVWQRDAHWIGICTIGDPAVFDSLCP
jgi:hypothetical protein